ncbi:hypothetical protein EYF80_039771 [Liparis tanakae]|uniref:Uncharacterized protein n=1 Tax=Liparis tanakae TaxID=230148 RepID=A0A4Z2G9Z3_9TELE|nr:hypothetical protein EYF80_039771 [Liparis tanakae]
MGILSSRQAQASAPSPHGCREQGEVCVSRSGAEADYHAAEATVAEGTDSTFPNPRHDRPGFFVKNRELKG